MVNHLQRYTLGDRFQNAIKASCFCYGNILLEEAFLVKLLNETGYKGSSKALHAVNCVFIFN